MSFSHSSRNLLCLGSLAFGAWGLVNPRSLARAAGDDEGIAPWLGVRDALVGVALLKFAGPLPLLARAASDATDAVRLRRKSPGVAAVAAAFAVWSALAAVGLRKTAR
jgi:hypothetical protein